MCRESVDLESQGRLGGQPVQEAHGPYEGGTGEYSPGHRGLGRGLRTLESVLPSAGPCEQNQLTTRPGSKPFLPCASPSPSLSGLTTSEMAKSRQDKKGGRGARMSAGGRRARALSGLAACGGQQGRITNFKLSSRPGDYYHGPHTFHCSPDSGGSFKGLKSFCHLTEV